MNIEVRKKYMKYRRSIFAWITIFLAIFTNAIYFLAYAITEQFIKGIIAYLGMLALELALSKAIYSLIYGKVLEEEYQWGNPHFEDFEGKYMDKLYIRGKISDEEFDDYFYENNRTYTEEDIEDCNLYFKREDLWVVILNLVYGGLGVLLFVLIFK